MKLRAMIAGVLFTLGIVLGTTSSRCFAQANSGVTVREDEVSYTLENGIVAARVDKQSGDLVSMKYKGTEILATIVGPDGLPDMKADPAGANSRGFGPFTDHQYGFWSHDAMGPRDSEPKAVASVTIDPKSNNGERGEVAVKGVSNSRKMGTGPGSNAGGNFISDIEIRWALGRGDSGVYTYCAFEHKPEYPASTITEARFCAKLADFFDWMSVADDEHHNKHYPQDLREGDKYVYTANQFNNRAFGWSSSTKNIGFFEINPSMEYMSGGPTKIEFLGHRDTNTVAAPCVLNYWRSSHYGGAEVSVAAGEHWAKVIGPFLLYVNSGGDSQALYKDAKAQAAKEAQKWPFDWVKGVDYPSPAARATVSGQLVLTDSQMPLAKLPNLLVGLTAPPWTMAGFGDTNTIDWQRDAKNYEFWVRGGADGQFTIPSVRAGTYTMHAFADGVLGEFAKADVIVQSGKALDLGKIIWTPVRRGRELWAIGIPNRYGSEFFKGDIYYTPGIAQTYADLFPNDITYTIGKSDYTKDWFFLHVPHYDVNAPPPPARGGVGRGAAPATGPAGLARGNAPATAPTGVRGGPDSSLARGGPPTTGPAGARGRGAGGGFVAPPPANGRAAPRTIVFDLPAAAHGKATLRIAFSATSARSIDVAVNDKSAGQFDRLPGDGAISSHGMHGIWHEKELSFDASLLKQGQNTLKLTIPADAVNNGVIYDYLRLELDESAVPTASAAQ